MIKRSCLAYFAVLGLFAAPASANMLIVPTFGNSITSDPNASAIKAAINAAISQIDSLFSDPITVPILFLEGSGLGSSSTPIYQVPYTAYRAALIADAKSADDATAVARDLTAQTNSPVDGQVNMWITAATLDAVGLAQPTRFIWDHHS